MLIDAVAAEGFRLWRNRSTRFWGFVFVPLALLAFHLVLDTYLRVRFDSGAGIDLGLQVMRGMQAAQSAYLQIFFALGAAGIFASEYRWETWRLIIPRNSRTNLLLAKFIVYGAASALSIAALAVMGLLHTLYAGLIVGTLPALPQTDFLPRAAGIFAASWLELMVMGGVTALVAVSWRATTGAAMFTIIFGIFQSAVMTQMSVAPSPMKLALVPHFAADTLGAFASGREIGPDLYIGAADGLMAASILIGWVAALAIATLAIFRRQDLSRE